MHLLPLAAASSGLLQVAEANPRPACCGWFTVFHRPFPPVRLAAASRLAPSVLQKRLIARAASQHKPGAPVREASRRLFCGSGVLAGIAAS